MNARHGSALVALVAGALVAAACGSSGEASSAPPPSVPDDAAIATDAASSPSSGRDAGAPTPPDGFDAAAPPLPPLSDAGAPLIAPDGTWTWIDIAGAVCANGSPTGIGVNLASQSDDVLVFFEGGGACWDGSTCWGAAPQAFYMGGYGATEFATDPQRTAMYVLNRTDTQNPFRDKNMIYVPYCTGDAFTGNAVVTFYYLGTDHVTHFAGYPNFGLVLSRLVSTFSSAKRLWVAGDSAGGFGSAFNMGRVQEAFPRARVDALDDSGQPIAPDPAQWAKWKSTWNMMLPADCAGCKDGPNGLVDYYKTKYPNSRFGLVSFQYDTVIAPFMNLSLTAFHDELYAMADHVDATWPNGRYFILAGSSHVGLAVPTAPLKDWVNRMVTDSPSWGSTRP